MRTSRVMCLTSTSGASLDLAVLAEEFRAGFEAARQEPVSLTWLGHGVCAVDIGKTRLGFAHGDAGASDADASSLLVSIGDGADDPAPCSLNDDRDTFLAGVAEHLGTRLSLQVSLSISADEGFDLPLVAKARLRERRRGGRPVQPLEPSVITHPAPPEPESTDPSPAAPAVSPRRVARRAEGAHEMQRLVRVGRILQPAAETNGPPLTLYYDGSSYRPLPSVRTYRDPEASFARAVFREPPARPHRTSLARQVARATALGSAAIAVAQGAAAGVLTELSTLPPLPF